ncbi:MAG TPA: 50S ribosomal protein L32e [Candidatus Woesearchaeota archaeon]|nr:50S ribosomal protein L32e [Candidatus Woesearchaeota archaeon]
MGMIMAIKESLDLRKKIKGKKPEYKFPGSKKRVKNQGKWRKPKGHQSKIRRKFRGHIKMAQIGYSSPVDVRGFHSSGLAPVVVMNPAKVSQLDPNKNCVFIGSTVGLRKKISILEEAKKLELLVVNASLEELKSRLDQKKKAKEEKKKKKKKTMEKIVEEKDKEDKEKKAKEQEKEEKQEKKKDDDAKKDEELSPEEKEKQMRREYEKLLTKRS